VKCLVKHFAVHNPVRLWAWVGKWDITWALYVRVTL